MKERLLFLKENAYLLTTIFLFINSFNSTAQNYCNSTPVEVHGNLSVSGTKIVDQNNNPVSFAGNSYFWSNNGWGGEKYYNSNVVGWLKEDWNSTIVRAAMGVEDSGGYISNPIDNKNKVKAVVDAAITEGIYVIIDWHSHHAEDNQAQAISFFQEMAQTYGNNPHVIYEIYNEPLQVSWSGTIKPYAEAVISAIRAIDSDNLIIVGTPTWSQDVDVASNDPITSSINIAYTLHFYAATHKESLRQKAQTALNNGIALMVTEWGTVSADGNGIVDNASTDDWMSFLAANDITHANWSINDKSEGASALNPGASSTGGWSSSDLTSSGTKVKSIIQNWNQYCSGGTPLNQLPTVQITNPNNNSSSNTGTNIQISASASDSDGSISQVEFFLNGTSIGIDTTSPYNMDWNPSSEGTYSITAIATDNENATSTSASTTVTINNTGSGTTSAYPNGVPHSIQGTINATNYDTGGQGVSYNDLDTGNNGTGPRSNNDVDTENSVSGGNVGWIETDEWLNYTVNVETTGSYNITYEVASNPGGGVFHLEFAGTDVTGNVNVATTGGWGTFTTIESQNIQLTQGEQIMRIAIDQGAFNIGNITFTLNSGGGTPTNQAPSTSITSPLNNSTLTEGSTIQITANASDSDGSINQVEFFVDNISIGTDSSNPYSTDWTPTAGTYSITSVATDNENLNTTSSSISVTVDSASTGCSGLPTWTSSDVYASTGTQVAYNGNIYQNNWYSSGQNPESNSGQWQVWSLVGSCSGTAKASNTKDKAKVIIDELAIDLVIYPTISSDGRFNIISKEQIVRAQIMDINGRIVKDIDNRNRSIETIEVKAKSGLYISNFTTKSGKTIVKKLIIQ